MKTKRCLFVRRPVHTALALALLLMAAGCSSKGSVSGKVLFRGEPLPGGMVIFSPPEGTGGGTGTINPKDGTYRIEGLAPGTMKVTVRPYQEIEIPSFPMGHSFGPPKDVALPPEAQKAFDPNAKGKEEGARTVEIPLKYTDPEQSGLTCTLKGGAQEFNITLVE